MVIFLGFSWLQRTFAPAIKAVTTQAEINFPEQYAGSWVILFSHPVDFILVCISGFITFISYPLSLGRNFDELLRVLAAIQTADAFSTATLADWQPGEDVIVPAAVSPDRRRSVKITGIGNLAGVTEVGR